MGEVVSLVPRLTDGPPSNDNRKIAVVDVAKIKGDRQQVLSILSDNGVKVFDDQSARDFKVIMRMVQGMRDRQAGNSESDDCLYLESLAQAMYGCMELPENENGDFDDLLSKM